jgi:hypothetical protein
LDGIVVIFLIKKLHLYHFRRTPGEHKKML